jgi:hypothetical protein
MKYGHFLLAKNQLRIKNVSIKLESSKSVYISIPRDGRYGQINYQGSGVNYSLCIYSVIVLLFVFCNALLFVWPKIL